MCGVAGTRADIDKALPAEIRAAQLWATIVGLFFLAATETVPGDETMRSLVQKAAHVQSRAPAVHPWAAARPISVSLRRRCAAA
ncbi:hypothetical protein MPLB_660027 [Mesorhizobium sp. ORS 3324]|nr:hypothetical protein MPLB_660027 [Mesorhizobium sp. ORS 3324]